MDIDDDSLAKIMGHADYDVTSSIYIQSDLGKLHSEMSKLEPLPPNYHQT